MGDDALDFSVAGWASFQGIFSNSLSYLKNSALIAFILVDGHRISDFFPK